MNYTVRDNLIYSVNFSNIKNKEVKIASFDLDHTIIRPKNNRTHPKSIDDFEFVFENVLTYLEQLIQDNYLIIIFSNQSNLNQKLEKKNIVLGRKDKLYGMFKHFNIVISTKNDNYRKPNTDMFNFIEMLLKNENISIDKKNSFFVGDAGGRNKYQKYKKDFSCSDRKFALNLNINFFTPESYFLGSDIRELNNEYICENKSKILFPVNENLINENINTKKKLKKFNIIIFIGPQASGKSSLANNFENYNIVNQDKLLTKNKTIGKVKNLLERDINSKIILDNTNGSIKYRKTFTDYFKSLKLNYCFVVFNINKEQSLFLNNYRCKLLKKSRIPEVAIHSYYKYYNKPTDKEGYSELLQYNFIPNFKNNKDKKIFYEYN